MKLQTQPEAPLRPTVYAVLLALTEQQRKGRELLDDTAKVTEGTVQMGPGTLYRTLHRMRAQGLIADGPQGDVERAEVRDYEITDEGRRALSAMTAWTSALVGAADKKGFKGDLEAAPARRSRDKPPPVPEEFNTVLPHIIVSDSAKAAEFYKQAFGADELYRDQGPDGRIWHLELLIGATRLALSDEFAGMKLVSPSQEGNSVIIHHYVEDVDGTFKRAIGAGATPLLEPDDTYWGDRYAQIQDPFGHRWALATRVDDPSPSEEKQRGAKFRSDNPDIAIDPPM